MEISRSLRKNIWREIRSTLGRFVAIFAISALGAGFFAGLKATSPDMKATADRYYESQQLMDCRLISTMGFTEDDIEALRQRPEVKQVMAGYALDLLVSHAEGDRVVHFIQLPQDTSPDNPSFMNQPVITEGRMPQNGTECLVDDLTAYQVGDVLELSGENDEDSLDLLAGRSYTVVGRARSPLYISIQRGNTGIGNGRVDFFVLVGHGAFSSEYYTEVLLTLKDAQGMSSFAPAYQAAIDASTPGLESFGQSRAQVRYDDIYAEASEALEDARQELAEGRAEADEKLAEAAQEILDAEAEIAKGKKTIAENEQKIKDAEEEIAEGEKALAEGEQASAEARQKLEQGQQKYDAGYAEYQAGLAEYNTGKAKLDALKGGVDAIPGALAGMSALTGGGVAEPPADMLPAYEQAAEGVLQAAEGMVEYLNTSGDAGGAALAGAISGVAGAGRSALDAARASGTGYANVYLALAALDAGGALYPQMSGALDQGLATLAEAKVKLDEAARRLNASAVELDEGWAALAAGERALAEARQKLEQARTDLANGKKELENGKKELEDAEAELAEGKAEYAEEKAKADKELADAEEEINEAQLDLDELKPPDWYVRTRDDSPGYSGFDSDAARIDAIAAVIPVFFFLVAALVCLTTMTRMVEEQRSLIGGLKALGYSTGAIAFKFMFYAVAASLSGAVVGVLVGFVVFPGAIWNAYGMLYNMSGLAHAPNVLLAVVSVVACVMCTGVATLAACLGELRTTPAGLMRPKAPRAGKRVLLERVGPLWRRLSFMAKVTVRNLFRYKKRFFMTVIGVAGCTALLLTGFGLRDSISGIVPRQYGGIYLYDLRAVLTETSGAEKHTPLNEELVQMGESMYFIEELIDARAGRENNVGMTTYLFVPQDSQRIDQFVDFHNRQTGEAISFPEEGAIITEKLALRLNVEVGDEIEINPHTEAPAKVRVAGIMENYVFNTVYVSAETYQQLYGKRAKFDNLLVNLPQDADATEALSALVATEGVAGAMDVPSLITDMDDMFDSLNAVVWVVIAAAALLAFVVLYNLTNINITERTREIATLKVLGFYNNEVASYIFRENILLTLIGTLAGLVLGVALHSFVIQAAEVDEMMFRRVIEPLSYVLAVVFTLLCGMVVNLAMTRRLRDVNMVESLKSVE